MSMTNSSENIPGIRYRVGIDVGLRSIGFCAVEVDRNDQPVKLLNSMVFRVIGHYVLLEG